MVLLGAHGATLYYPDSFIGTTRSLLDSLGFAIVPAKQNGVNHFELDRMVVVGCRFVFDV